MIIRSLKLTNFRQFVGEHLFEFNTADSNVTIIIGENGKGKTGIFRALMFVLYGRTQLEQDNFANDIQLVNFDLLEANINIPVTATVELVFEYNKNSYVITRSISSIKSSNGKIDSQQTKSELASIENKGDYTPLPNENPDSFINGIVNNEISDFFFFDAEKMSLLDNAKSAQSVSKEVHDGIIRLLQIKSLSETSDLLRQTLSEKTAEINKKSKNSNFKNLNSELDNASKDNEQLEFKLDNLFKEKQAIIKEIDSIEKKLAAYEEISNIQSNIKSEKEKMDLSSALLTTEKKKIKSDITNSINLLALPLLEKNESDLLSHLESKSDKIPLDIIQQSLDVCQCMVCQTNFDNNSIQYLLLDEIKNKYTYSNVTPIIKNAIKTIAQLRENEQNSILEVKTTIQNLVSHQEKVNKYELNIQILEDSLSDEANTLNLDILDKQRIELKETLRSISDKISQIKYQIEMNNKLITELNLQIDKTSRKLEGLNRDVAVREKIQIMHEILLNTKDDYTNDISETLAKEMTNTFFTLLDGTDRDMFDRVVIDPKFNIKLLDNTGINRSQELSMGQGQIFTLAFILSLAKLASKGRTEINFPLFMDTPFARLSGTNRDNLIEHIPTMTNQWILLLTDTELSSTERMQFEKFGRVGNIYELKLEGKATKSFKINSLKDSHLRRVNQ